VVTGETRMRPLMGLESSPVEAHVSVMLVAETAEEAAVETAVERVGDKVVETAVGRDAAVVTRAAKVVVVREVRTRASTPPLEMTARSRGWCLLGCVASLKDPR